MIHQQRLRIVAALVVIAIVAGAVALWQRQSSPIVLQPTPLPTRPRPGYTPVPSDMISPVVVQRSPARGEEMTPDGVIELTFDRPMDQQSVEAAFQLSPAVSGKIEWPSPRLLRFRPSQTLTRATLYDVVLGQGARAADGAQLNEAYQFRFATSGYLEIGQVIPANDTQDVQTSTAITVMFNRPVVPLTVVEQQNNAPQPVSFEPAIAGKGEWLSTAVYMFHPAKPLAGGTTYTGRIAAGLKDVAGNPLRDDYTWTFTTGTPEVVFVSPADKAELVSIEPVVVVRFNQQIDPAGAKSAFHLRSDDGDEIQGTLSVVSETLTFTPSQRLKFDLGYRIEVDAGLSSSSGGTGMTNDHRSSFRTVPLPKIVSTTPSNGERNANPFTDFTITFNTPIAAGSVMPNIQMTPPLSPTQVYTYFNEYDRSFHIYFGATPSTDYQVQIGPNIADPYGNTTGQTLAVRFRTDALPPSVQLLTPSGIGTYHARTPARVTLASVNQKDTTLSLYRLQPSAVNSWDWSSETPSNATLLRRWQVQIDSPLDKTVYTSVDLVEGGGRLDPGVYLLQLPQANGGIQAHLMVVSEINLTLKAGEREALVWANDLLTGEPVAGLALDFFEEQGAALGSATTDRDGVARLDLKRTDNRGVVAIAQKPFAAGASSWSSGVSPWEFGLQATGDLPELTMYVYTDRPIYRPGQTVFFKGIVRAEDDARFSLPADLGTVQVTIRSTTGEQVYQQNAQLNTNGTFHGELKLAPGAALGPYQIEVGVGERSFSSSFQVAAYRPPEFEVKVTTATDEVLRGTPISAAVDVSYFFGGPVANAAVSWNIMASPYSFSPDWGGRFQFNDFDDPWYCWHCWWTPPPPAMPILSGSGTTDAKGQLTINLPAQLTDSNGTPITRSVQLMIEASVTGKDNQVISGRREVVVHRGQFYIGLAPQTYVGKAGEEQRVDLVAVDITDQRLSKQTIDVEVVRYEWKNSFIEDTIGGGRWEWQEIRTPITRGTVTTDEKGEAVFAFTPSSGGSYRLRATARDSGGREVASTLFLWVAGDDYIPWRRENNDRISLISDKTTYKPGETADILIPSPYQGQHWALITVERGGILSHEVRKLTSNSTIYRLPITAEHVPNVYVSVVLFSPPEAVGRPADYKVGILPLSVEPLPQSLQIALKPSQTQAEPGQPISYDVQVTDTNGKPVATELSLDLVDKAVLSLMPRTSNAIREHFYSRRGLGIITSSGLSISADRWQQQLDKDLQSREDHYGEEAATGAAAEQPAPAQVPGAPFDAINAGLADAEGRLSLDQAQAPTIREEFADTAYWRAELATDENGHATVEIKLPDNLTTWVMRGVGLTSATQVGEGTVEVIATKPLLVRPVTPRFFVVGDSAELAANISNNTDEPLQVQVGLTTTGLTITGELTQTVQIPAKGEATVTWQASPHDVAAADLVFSASSGQYSDASRPRLATGPNGTLRVYRYSVPEVVGTGGQLTEGGSRTEVIGLPPNIDTRSGELTVRLDPSLAAGMRDGLQYLEHYPYESADQIVSAFLPNILTVRALKELGINKPELEQTLPDLVEEAIAKLSRQQHSDGGWGWWVDDESNAHVSAYVVFGLFHAKQQGFAVNEDTLNRGVEYLATVVQRNPEPQNRADANQRAWLLYVLSEAGRSDNGQLTSLYEQREKLAAYAKALLAMSLHKSNAGNEQIKTLLSDLNSAAILSATGAHWEEEEYDWWSMNTDTRSTAIILSALVQLDPQNQINPNVVRWLMVARKGGIWETTQESAWAIIALTDWMAYTKELKADYDYAAWLNDKEQTAGHVGQADVDKPVELRIAIAELLRDTGNRLTIGRGPGEGRLYYTAHLRAFLPVKDVKALDRGMIVRRRYTLASCTDGPKCPEVTQIKLGDVVRVELSIIAPNDLYYVAVEDPLPAGAEAIDPNLATTSRLEPGGQLTPVDPIGPILREGDVAEGSPRMIDWYWGWWHWYSRSEMRDEKVVLFADYLPKGSYLYSYTMRATLPGEFQVIPTTASEMYFPEVYGRGDGKLLKITK